MALSPWWSVALLLVVTLASTNAFTSLRYAFQPFLYCSRGQRPLEVLQPGVEYYDLRIGFGDTQVYQLGKLEPNQEYEVRTSSPGLFAAEFFVTFVCDIDSLSPEQGGARSLLNVEKAMFKTDSSGLVTRCTHEKGKSTKYGVKIFARLEGFTTDSSLYTQPVAYNLMLEKVWLGIPNRVIGVLAFAVILVLVVVAVVLSMPSLISPLKTPLAGSLQSTVNAKKSN